jgi:hypothetical protein
MVLEHCLNYGIENLICTEIIKYIMEVQKSFGKDDYDYERNEIQKIVDILLFLILIMKV